LEPWEGLTGPHSVLLIAEEASFLVPKKPEEEAMALGVVDHYVSLDPELCAVEVAHKPLTCFTPELEQWVNYKEEN